MLRRRSTFWMQALPLVGSFALGCAGAPREPMAVVIDAPENAAVTKPCRPPALKTVMMPSALSLDGELSEWGDTPSEAQLRLAIDHNHLAMALDHSCDEPILVTLAAAAPPYPRIGWVGGPMMPIDIHPETCAREIEYAGDGGTQPGPPHPPEDQRRCLLMLTDAQAKEAELVARFQRSYRVSREGVFDGAGRLISGAAVAHRQSALEVSLPLGALPRVAEAPWENVYAAASLALGAPKLGPVMLRHWEEPEVPTGWTALQWPLPLSPDSYADLRWAGASAPSNGVVRTVASYQPAEPDRFEIVQTPYAEPGFLGMTRPVLVIREEPLFEVVRDFGRVSIGWSHTDSLATIIEGRQLVAEHALPRAQVFFFERGAELHAFGYHGEGYAPGAIPVRGYWEAIAISEDGTIRELDSEMALAGWDTPPQPYFDAAQGGFGFDGQHGGKPRQVIWKWNAGEGRYDAGPYNPFELP